MTESSLRISPFFWVLFNLFVLGLLVLDMGFFHKKAKAIPVKEALGWSLFWISLALGFNLIIYAWLGSAHALDFLAGYLLEKSLSVDNVFIFAVVFKYFQVAPAHQYRVLFLGILGALVMRALFIFAGISLLTTFHWVIYLFGFLLLVTGVRMGLSHDEQDIDPSRNIFVRFAHKYLRVTEDFHSTRFFIKRSGIYWATPLFIVLIVVETTDLVFAIDSIPAVLAITQDAFIVYTSNVFAILGLRSLYFALSGMMAMFHHLHYALAAILVFVGAKMLVSDFIELSTPLSLIFILVALLLAIITSKCFPKKP